MTDKIDVVCPVPVYNCHECTKTYAIKSSYQSHKRLRHRANKVSEDLENVSKTTKKTTSSPYFPWMDTEKDERPLILTRELDSFLDNGNDASLVAAAAESEEMAEAEAMGEKLRVKSHELEWYQEDNELNFSEEFRRNFASSLRESLPSQEIDPLAKLHNDVVKKLKDKYDNLVVRTTQQLKIAEITKTDLRKKTSNH